jgi:hypothetical protein
MIVALIGEWNSKVRDLRRSGQGEALTLRTQAAMTGLHISPFPSLFYTASSLSFLRI